jgi:hypothetical protein
MTGTAELNPSNPYPSNSPRPAKELRRATEGGLKIRKRGTGNCASRPLEILTSACRERLGLKSTDEIVRLWMRSALRGRILPPGAGVQMSTEGRGLVMYGLISALDTLRF